MRRYSVEPRTIKYIKGNGFLSFARKYDRNYWIKDYLKTASKKVVHRAGEFLGNKFLNTVTKPNDDKIIKTDENSRNVEEIIILLEKRDKILNELRKVS